MIAPTRFSSLRAAGEGALVGGFVCVPMAIGCYFIDRNAGIATAAYLAIGMSMGGLAILVARFMDCRRQRQRTEPADTHRLRDCEARCVALQAALLACASAAGPDTLRLVSTQFNLMMEFERNLIDGSRPINERTPR